jgi:hypothetical protein
VKRTSVVVAEGRDVSIGVVPELGETGIELGIVTQLPELVHSGVEGLLCVVGVEGTDV